MAAFKPKNNASSSSRACANCGAQEDPPGTALSACARCHLVFYCSKPCQVLHWKQKPAGHKQICITNEERRPTDAEIKQATEPLKGESCAICLGPISSSSAADCCTFHVPCAEGLRSFGTKQTCPILHVQLPSEPEQLFEGSYQSYFPLEKLVKRSGRSWSRLTATQTRTIGKVIRSLKVAADQGYAEAQYIPEIVYERGQGVV